jgi:hypothetical protein
MRNLETLRDRLKADRNPGHEIATFLLGHSNSIDYLIGHLEGALEALKADQEAERCFAGGLLRAVKREGAPDRFRAAITAGTYDGWNGFNQFRHDVPAALGKGDLLDHMLEKHEGLGERDRLSSALEDYLEILATV